MQNFLQSIIINSEPLPKASEKECKLINNAIKIDDDSYDKEKFRMRCKKSKWVFSFQIEQQAEIEASEDFD